MWGRAALGTAVTTAVNTAMVTAGVGVVAGPRQDRDGGHRFQSPPLPAGPGLLVQAEGAVSVNRHPGEDALLDGGQAFGGAGDLDVHVGAFGRGVQFLRLRDGGRGVVQQQGRDLQRHPPVDTVGALVRGCEQIGGPAPVAQRQLEERILVGSAGRLVGGDVGIVVRAGLDGLVEDRGIGGQP